MKGSLALTLVLALLAVLLCSVIASPEDFLPAIDPALIEQINSDPSCSWKAGVNSKFANLTIGEAKKFLNSFVPPSDEEIARLRNKKVVSFENDSTRAALKRALPDAYDPDTVYPQCAVGIINQGSCGSSWAFPVVHAAGNRYCIAQAKQGKTVPYHYSTQYLLSCDTEDFCCSGGYLDKAFDFVEANGLPSDACFNYTSGKGACPKCPVKCDDGSDMTLYKTMKPNTTRSFKDVESSMLDIMTYGYVATGIEVYTDFFSYKSGVYFHKSGSPGGGHGIRVNGWGVDSVSGLPYWIAPNTFGTDWGMKGYAWVRRGKNEGKIETYMTAATPFDN